MNAMAAMLAHEFAQEARVTRRLVARLPLHQGDWRPHARSFTALELAAHLVDCISWTDAIFSHDQLDLDPVSYQPCWAATIPALLDLFDVTVARGTHVLEAATDDDLLRPWRFSMLGRVRFEKPKLAAVRDLSLSHLIHHRGQFSVYLRLLEVAVPGAYGPTADDRR